jgi:hypothetical protein
MSPDIFIPGSEMRPDPSWLLAPTELPHFAQGNTI